MAAIATCAFCVLAVDTCGRALFERQESLKLGDFCVCSGLGWRLEDCVQCCRQLTARNKNSNLVGGENGQR